MNLFAWNLLAFCLTVVVEFVVYLSLLRDHPGESLLFSVLINALTQPLAMYAHQVLHANLWVVEFVVVSLEWPLILGLFRISGYRSLSLALSANAASAVLSLFFN